MKTFEYTVGDLKLSVSVDQNSVVSLLANGQAPLPTEAEMPAYAAAISLALIENEVEVVHDDEPGIITVEHHHTGWNNPAKQMNQI